MQEQRAVQRAVVGNSRGHIFSRLKSSCFFAWRLSTEHCVSRDASQPTRASRRNIDHPGARSIVEFIVRPSMVRRSFALFLLSPTPVPFADRGATLHLGASARIERGRMVPQGQFRKGIEQRSAPESSRFAMFIASPFNHQEIPGSAIARLNGDEPDCDPACSALAHSSQE